MGVTPYRLKNGQKRWRADTWVSKPDGTAFRVVRKGLPTKEMAQRLLDKVRIDAFEGKTFEKKRLERITVRELWDVYAPVCKARNRGWETYRARAASLNRHLGDRKAASLRIEDVTKYREARRAELFHGDKVPTESTLNREIGQLRHLLNFGVQTGKLTRNPLGGIRGLLTPEDNARDVWIDEGEFERLHEKAEPELKPILLVAYDTGMRKGEILGLRWSQVELRPDVGCIRLQSSDTKSRKPREIPLTTRVREALAALPCSVSDYVFVNPETGTRWNQIKKVFHRARHAAGLDHIRFHDLRRSFVTNARKRGVPESVVMRVSGHRTRSVFERYNIVNDEDVRDAVKVIEAGQGSRWRKAEGENLGNDLVTSEEKAS